MIKTIITQSMFNYNEENKKALTVSLNMVASFLRFKWGGEGREIKYIMEIIENFMPDKQFNLF